MENRKKKTLIVAVASLLLISGLVTTTFSNYTDTLRNIGEGEINTKDFVFVNVGSVETQHCNLSLAPGETQDVKIKIANYEDTRVSQVDMDVTFTINISGSLVNYIEYNEPDNYTFSANVKQEYEATITFAIPETAGTEIIGKTATFNISATATQKIH